MKTKVFEGTATVHAASGMKELAGFFVLVAPNDRLVVETLGYAVVQAFTSAGRVDLAFNSKQGSDIHPTTRDTAKVVVGLVDEARARAKRAPKL